MYAKCCLENGSGTDALSCLGLLNVSIRSKARRDQRVEEPELSKLAVFTGQHLATRSIS